VPTTDRSIQGIADPLESKQQVETLEGELRGVRRELFRHERPRQGIVHIVGPEQGFTQPGMTIVCGDSTPRRTAPSARWRMASARRSRARSRDADADPAAVEEHADPRRWQTAPGVTAKDIILAIIGKIGTAGGTGYVIEYAGEAIRELVMEGRMTICNMSIEGGARAGLIAPDEKTFEYVKGRPMPRRAPWDKAVAGWKTLPSDDGAKYDTEVMLKRRRFAPQVTWGTSPEMVRRLRVVPDPGDSPSDKRAQRMLRRIYGPYTAGTPLTDITDR
jgi:3-isopropylmalate/(R)-2-methylmalate dehydratase large subunit